MDYIELGKTGVKVSVAALGCGGHSRLGQHQGAPIESSIRVVHEAIDLGINFIDTAEPPFMEEIVGQAIKDRRDSVMISTKLHTDHAGVRTDATTLRSYVEGALTRLHSEVIDLFYLQGIKPSDYDYSVDELLPELERLRARGLIRFVGATESWAFNPDLEHSMLSRAVHDDYWDVIMSGFNLLNPSARRLVFPAAIAQNIGVFAMYAVRDLLSRPDLLREAIQRAIDEGVMDADAIDVSDPLGFLVHDGGASSVVEAAYRFVRHEPGVHAVLTGTGNVEHLRANVDSVNLGPLPEADLRRLASLFGHLTYFSANAPSD
jgi:L-galactose dehydrogenase